MTTHLAYTRKGSGEPLVLIHGIGHRRQAWNPVFERLSESYDVIAVDLAGFGESDPYPSGTAYTMENACSILEENFAAWGISKPHVVGNSLGGAISLELGARGLVSSVTALSPAGFFRGVDRIVAFFGLMLLKLASYLPAGVVQPTLRSSRGRHLIGRTLFEHGERLSADEFIGDSVALRNGSAFYPTLLAGLDYHFAGPTPVPTTIAWGTRDRILPFAQSGLARERLPLAQHTALPNCGHVPMVDDPELIVRIIDRTIASAKANEKAA
jgi:pimeloyl-ACP methyl ester carboxylesterase